MNSEQVREHVLNAPEVDDLLQLRPLGGDLYRYLIETTHQTFPKFVIGVFNAETKEVQLEAWSGHYDTIRDRWQILNLGVNPNPQSP